MLFFYFYFFFIFIVLTLTIRVISCFLYYCWSIDSDVLLFENHINTTCVRRCTCTCAHIHGRTRTHAHTAHNHSESRTDCLFPMCRNNKFRKCVPASRGATGLWDHLVSVTVFSFLLFILLCRAQWDSSGLESETARVTETRTQCTKENQRA